jgi:hypothetical protein
MNQAEVINSLHNLKHDQKPIWGKMTPQHMVEHLYKTMQASINEITLKIYSEERRIPVFKKLFFGDRPFPKEFMNPAIGPDLMKLEFQDLTTAIKELENILIRYEKFFQENPTGNTIHPIFGYLTKEEWDIFHQKHFKHHLSQFGISD